MLYRSFTCAAALAAVVGMPATFAWAGSVELVSQERSLSAEVVQRSSNGEEAREDQDSASATGFGVFEGAVDARVENEPAPGEPAGSEDSFATGRVRSDIRDDGFDAAGDGSAYNISSDNSGSFVNDLFRVVFDVTGSVRFDGTFTSATEGGPGTTSATLRRTDDAGETLEDFEFITNVPGDDSGLTPNTSVRTLDRVLGAGRYEFSTEVRLPSDDASRTYAFLLDVDLEDADTDGGGETPIPLPPAALAGLSVMGGAGLLGSVRKRLRARRA